MGRFVLDLFENPSFESAIKTAQANLNIISSEGFKLSDLYLVEMAIDNLKMAKFHIEDSELPDLRITIDPDNPPNEVAWPWLSTSDYYRPLEYVGVSADRRDYEGISWHKVRDVTNDMIYDVLETNLRKPDRTLEDYLQNQCS